MPEPILREKIMFSTAENLLQRLQMLDPAFRAAAQVVDYDYDEAHTYGGVAVKYNYITFEASVSP